MRTPGAFSVFRYFAFMKIFSVNLLAMCLLVSASNAFSQASFDVISLDGSAKVQRVSKKDWVKLTVGSQVADNDIVETFFQTKMVLQFGKGNVAILGSNSKALVNIREQTESGTSKFEVNLTLFSGGCFVKAISNCHISVYTSNGVGETDDGSFSTVVESKTGETGFQILGGTIKARNIAQKEGLKLTSGQTTMISPGKEPTAPLYITVRHVSVLKHFFGGEYIESELSAAGIKPTEEKTAGSTSLSQSLASQQFGKTADQGMYKTLFSLNKIWGSILDEREKYGFHFTPVNKPDVSDEHKVVVQESNVFSIARGGMFPQFIITPSFYSKFLGAGLRVPFAANHTQQISMYNFSSLSGILDIIDHVRLGPFGDSTFITFGPIEDYTLGRGLVVNRFNNYNPYSLFHPLGLRAQVKFWDFSVHGFIADLSAFSPGGVRLSYEPTVYHFGAAYFYDANQFYQQTSDSAGYRLVNFPKYDSAATVLLDSALHAHIYQFDFASDIIATYDFQLTLGAAFAQKLVKFHHDGFVLRAPDVSISWSTINISGGLVAETGRLVEGQFNQGYMSNRARLDTMGLRDTLLTQNTILGSRRRSGKFELAFKMNIIKGTALSASYKQNIYDKYSIATDSTVKSPDLGFGLSFSVNDSLWQPIKYGKLFFEESYGGLFPPHSVFPSWGFKTGFDIITNPILFGVGISGGVCWYYLDMNSNNAIDPTDNVFEFYIGFRYGFM
jgi:hypothetical protein